MTKKHIIMINEEYDVDINNEEEEELEETYTEESEEEEDNSEPKKEDKKEKSFESPEAKRARLTRQLKQLDKQYPIEKKENKSKSSDLDYGQKAFLISNGIKGSDETEFVKGELLRFGNNDLDGLLENEYFQNKLKEFREKKSSANAIPNGAKRSNQTANSSLDYYLAKGEMPPVSEPELRRDYVNAKLKKDNNKGMFYNS